MKFVLHCHVAIKSLKEGTADLAFNKLFFTLYRTEWKQITAYDGEKHFKILQALECKRAKTGRNVI